MQMYRQTDMTVLIVAACSFLNAPKMDSQLVFPLSIPRTHFHTLLINVIYLSSSWSSMWLFPKDVDTKLYMLSNSILFSTNKPFWTKIKYSIVLSVNLLCQMSCKSITLFGQWHVQQDLSMRQYIQKIWKSMSIWCKYKVYVTMCISRCNTFLSVLPCGTPVTILIFLCPPVLGKQLKMQAQKSKWMHWNYHVMHTAAHLFKKVL